MAFRRRSQQEARRALEDLVAAYAQQAAEVEAPGSPYPEAQARLDFIDRLLDILGWDVHNAEGLPQSRREVVVELSGTGDDQATGRPDYRLRADGLDRLPVEAKKPSLHLSAAPLAARQARSYGWSLSLPAAVLTNFSELVIYDARITPQEGDPPHVAVIPGCRFRYTEYVSRFDELWERLAYEEVTSDRFYETYDYSEPPRGTSPFDRTFLADFRRWRRQIAQAIADGNPQLTAAEVGRRTQLILNALLFLRVCEDRDIGRYEGLLTSANAHQVVDAFKVADQVFNAGLFSVLDATAIEGESLAEVIRELYWPRSKFAFGVLRPDILAALYEQYLAERVELDGNGRVKLVEKPELTHAGGVVRTPSFVVDRLLDEALDPLLGDGGVPVDLRLLDPACGSGIFLVSALTRLATAAEVAGEAPGLALRARLTLEHIFGLDIDGEAVEVTKLALLLEVLGDERVDVATARDVLPDLERNIQAGNSLVGPEFDRVCPNIAAVAERRAAVSPFDWESAFPAVFAEGGFRVIVSNPPYIRIQTLSTVLPDQLEFFQHAGAGYGSSMAYNFDVYMLFVERGLQLLHPDGRLAYILPNRFTNALAGATVRAQLGPRLDRLVHFGQEQVFEDRTTYTALVVAGPTTQHPAEFELVRDLPSWLTGTPGETTSVPRAELTADPWPIASAARSAVFAKMEQAGVARLGDDDQVEIFVGVQTSADDIFFIRPIPGASTDELVAFADRRGRQWRIERGICRPAIRDQTLQPYDLAPEPDALVIFPYEIEPPAGTRTRPRAVVIPPAVMAERYPATLKYLAAHKDALDERSVSPDPGDAYYAFGRSQSLTRLDAPKIIVRVLSTTPRYATDPDGLVAPSGGDGGPYYLLRPTESCPLTLQRVVALLSHPAVDAYVASRGKAYRGSYVVHRKAFLKGVPIPEIDPSVDSRVDELQQIAVRLRRETDSAVRRSLEERQRLVRAEIEAAISAAFRLTDEDVATIVG